MRDRLALLGRLPAFGWAMKRRPETWRRIRLVILVVAGAVFLGRKLVDDPVQTIILATALGGFGLATLFRSGIQKFFLGSVLCILLGYAVLGRGFAYLGIAPLFVGELVLGLGLVAMVTSSRPRSLIRLPLLGLLLVYALWGAARTLPFLSRYGVDALRDAVIWGYAAYAIVVSVALLQLGWTPRVPLLYRKLVPWLLILLPGAFVIYRLFEFSLPQTPGADVKIISQKPGDVAVHLAGIGAFMLLGLHRDEGRERGYRSLRDWLWWTVWVAAFVFCASLGRGGMLSVFAAFSIAVLLGYRGRWRNTIVKPMVIAAGLGIGFFLSNAEIDIGEARTISAQQVTENVMSVFGKRTEEALEVTQEWRMNWWRDIVDYTFFGRYFWTGKGFGINLEEDDGYITLAGQESRNPHSAHLAILARAGVPGLVMWILLQVLFAVRLFRAHQQARAVGATWWARVDAWVLAYWAAFLVNGSFDIYLEGPQGGIWFWCVFGMGLALITLQRDLAKPARAPRPARAMHPGLAT